MYVCVCLVTLKAVSVVCVFQAFTEALTKLETVKSDSHKDSHLIMQLLRDNLTVTT